MFLEFTTYRWREHCGPNYDNHIGYRTEEEFQSWKEKEPISNTEKFLIDEGHVTTAQIFEMEKKIDLEIKAGFEFAEASPFPRPEDAFKDLYRGAKL